MSANLQELIQRVVAGSRDEADIQAIAAALQAGHLTLVTGDNAVGISGDATNAIIITGSNNVLVQGQVAEFLQAILEQVHPVQPMPTASVDELVQQVRSRLHDDIQSLHSTMPLWGVDHWVPLGELFVDVNILEELSSSRRSELDDLWQDFTTRMQESSYRSLDRIGSAKARERVPGLEVLTKNTNLMVVGKPGSGKTTYLQRVVTECNAGNLQPHRIPALIKLRDFVEDERSLFYSLEQYLERYWQLSTTETQLVLSQGRSLVLLDGLDEVTGEDGKTIVKQIKQFARTYPQVQMVVTCRTQSQESRFERFDYVEVADFNESQVRSFSEHWFKTVMQDGATGLAKSREFLDQLFQEENKPIRELAITPILLSLTCAVFHQTGKFYSKRSKLYEDGLELLLEQWDKSREIERDEIYRDSSVERKLKLLSYLAVKKFEQEQYVLFEQAEVEGYIEEFLGIGQRESRAVLKAIESQHGLLIERSRRVWSFSHLTFQEYFVAHYMIQDDHQSEKLLAQYLPEQYWQEVFLLFAEMSSDGNKLLKLMEGVAQKCVDTVNLQALLAWADRMTSSSMNDSKPVAKRTAALILFLAIPLSDNRELPFKRALEFYTASANDRNTAINLASNLSSSRARVPATAKARAETYARTRANNLLNGKNESAFEQKKGFDPNCAHALDLALSFEKNNLFKDVDFNLLVADLRKLNAGVPDQGQSPKAHEDFVEHFNQTWFNTFQLHQTLIDLPSADVEAVSKYLYTAKLLMKCKEAATQVCHEKWRRVEENFLLPIAEIEKRKREEVE